VVPKVPQRVSFRSRVVVRGKRRSMLLQNSAAYGATLAGITAVIIAADTLGATGAGAVVYAGKCAV
jgi:hypothetical protein